MQINGPGSIGHTQGAFPANRTHRAESAQPRRPHFLGADELDISREADALSRAHEADRAQEADGIRSSRVAEIRAQIEAGTYETPEKLEAAVERLLDELA